MTYKNEISEKENMLLCINGEKPAWLPSFYDACVSVAPTAFDRKKAAEPNVTVDIFGTEFTSTIDGPVPLSNLNQDFRLKDISKWREIMPNLDLKSINWQAEAGLIRNAVSDDKLILYRGGPVWEQLHYMMGFEEALVALLEEPELAYQCMDAMADYWIEALKNISRYVKPDMVVFAEHMATVKGPLMSPKTYREVIKPIHKKMFAAVLDIGAITEIHCDGYIEPLIADFADIGVMTLQPFQIFNDINRLKEQYKITAFGGWDCFGRANQSDSTEEECRESVRVAMDTYALGYRYAFLQGGAAPRYKKNLSWIADEARKYGRLVYQNG